MLTFIQLMAYPRSIFGKLETVLAENETPGRATQATGSARKRTLDASSPSNFTATQNKRARRDDAGSSPTLVEDPQAATRTAQAKPASAPETIDLENGSSSESGDVDPDVRMPARSAIWKLNVPRSKLSDGSSISSQRPGATFSSARLSKIVFRASTAN